MNTIEKTLNDAKRKYEYACAVYRAVYDVATYNAAEAAEAAYDDAWNAARNAKLNNLNAYKTRLTSVSGVTYFTGDVF